MRRRAAGTWIACAANSKKEKGAYENEQNKKVLERIGADLVVFPEVVVGKKIASMLSNPSLNEVMSLTEDYKIVEVATPDSWIDKTILDNDIRKKYNVSIVFVKREDQIINPEANTVLQKGDILVLAGETEKLNEISNKSSDVLNANDAMQDALDFE